MGGALTVGALVGVSVGETLTVGALVGVTVGEGLIISTLVGRALSVDTAPLQAVNTNKATSAVIKMRG